MPPVIDPIAQATFDFFLNNPRDAAMQARKMERLTTPPVNLGPFQHRLVLFLQNRVSPAQRPQLTDVADQPAGIVEKTMSKAALLAVLDFFEKRHCLCLKVCFGLDENLNPQLVCSGYFFAPDGSYTPDRMPTPYTYRTKGGRVRGSYFLNFGRPLSPGRAEGLKNRFVENTIAGRVRGYVMDIATYRRLLTDAAYLGAASQLRLRFGMNNHGDDPTLISPSGLSQTMMVEVASPDGVRAFYLCSDAVRNDDDTLPQCPPVEPC